MFFLRFYLFKFIQYVFAMAYIERSEDNLWELDFFYYVGPES